MSTAPPTKTRSTIYIDGFNFYFGIFANKPAWKWLNVQTFFEALRPRDELTIKYFTAIVDPKKTYSARRERQQLYLQALGTLPKIHITKGVFQPRTVRCDADCRKEYVVAAEKKTDANITIEMISDCLDAKTDYIILVSGDADQEPAIQWVNRRFKEIKLLVYVPVLPNEADSRRIDFYKSIGVPCYPLPLDGIEGHQFDVSVKIDKAKFVTRPDEWR